MKRILCTLSLALLASSAMAQGKNNVGCGLGSQVFDGQSGIFPQVLAATTNGTSGNQTFGISFGTLGCAQDGVVRAEVKASVYVASNRLTLARDVAAGRGESLHGLMAVMGVKAEDQAPLASLVRARFDSVFASEQVAANLKAVLTADARFAGYAATL